MKRYIVTFAVVVAAFIYMSDSDTQEAQAELKLYCDRVDVWQATQSPAAVQQLRREQGMSNVSGHPDYRGIYATQCGGSHVE